MAAWLCDLSPPLVESAASSWPQSGAGSTIWRWWQPCATQTSPSVLSLFCYIEGACAQTFQRLDFFFFWGGHLKYLRLAGFKFFKVVPRLWTSDLPAPTSQFLNHRPVLPYIEKDNDNFIWKSIWITVVWSLVCIILFPSYKGEQLCTIC